MSYASPRRAIAEREYQQKRRRQARVRRLALVLTAGGLLLLAVLAMTADRLLWPGGFPISEVYLEGEFKHVDPHRLRSEVVAALDGNFFSVDLARLETAAVSLPWVYQATVRRVWPRGVRVVIEEQRAVARWHDQAWLNIDGEVVRLSQIDGGAGLPQLSGPDDDAPEVLARFREWKPLLLAHGLQLRALQLSDRHAWRMQVHDPDIGNSFTLLLGRRDLAGRMQRFQRFYRQLPIQQKRPLQRVDARYPNGVAAAPGLQQQSETQITTRGDQV